MTSPGLPSAGTERPPARPNARSAQRAHVLSLPVDNVSLADTARIVERWAVRARTGSADEQDSVVPPAMSQIVTLNPEIAMLARRDPVLRQAIREAELVVPDGTGIVLASWLGDLRLGNRVTGVDVLEMCAHDSARTGYRVMLIGGEPGIAAEAARQLVARFPGASVSAADCGPVGDDTADVILDIIHRSAADVVFVALGAPAQERLIHAIKSRASAGVAIGVGGAFDYIAGKAPRAPRWMRAGGLEWIFRLIVQPWRWRRMLALPAFVLAVLVDRARVPKRKHP